MPQEPHEPQEPPPPTTLDGGCACGALRYRLAAPPLFVHACHCSRCQRETGGPFAHHALIERGAFTVPQGEPAAVRVPTDSRGRHWVLRCPGCQTAMWNEHGSRDPLIRYVRVGTLDEPQRCPPQAHIFVRSAQPWMVPPPGGPAFDTWYRRDRLWPGDSLARLARAQARQSAG